MKKLLILAAFALLGTTIQAQTVRVTERSIRTIEEPKAPKAPKKKIWLVRAGVSFDKLVGEDQFEDKVAKIGYDLSFERQKFFKKNNGLFWAFELGLGSRGMKVSKYDNYDKYALHNFRLSPFIFGYRYDFKKGVALETHLGAFFSVDYTGKNSWDINNHDGSVVLTDWADDLGLEWQRPDAGLRLGFGVWYKDFNFDLTWHRGFVKPWHQESYYSNGHYYYVDEMFDLKSSNVMLRVGYAF